MDEAGSGRWLGIRFPPLRPPLTAAEASALQARLIRAAQKHQAAVRRAEEQARKRAAATGGLLSSSNSGLCGLYNLGNTCFLNVSLQCLSHARALTRYFRSNTFLREINETNPLGSQGQLAMAYGTLIKQMWATKPLEAIEPKKMKLTIGKFRPQFSGNQQHDAQELLSFLLDGLHEDLNRVKQKPYIQTPDSAGRPDAVVAKEQWSNYRARDDSIIVDLYTGLLKSSLRFDKCGRVSTTFDAYTSLSLPLPKEKIKHLEVTVVWLEKADTDSNAASASSGGGRSKRRAQRAPTKFCIEFDSSVAFAAAATAAAAAHASKTVTAGASSTTAASSACSASAASLSAAAASATATAAALAISRPALAASTRIGDVKIALSRLCGVPVGRLQLARLQLSMYDIWKRRQFHFLQNYQSVSDYALSMQAVAGPAGNKNDVYYAFEVPEDTAKPATTAPAAAAPVTHVPTVGYIAADVSASSSSSYQSSLSSRPFVHDGMVSSHLPVATPHTAVASRPVTATPTPVLASASVSSTPSLPDNPVSHSAPYPTTFGGPGGMVQLGMKFDVKDSVAKWEVATVRDIRMLVSVQTMMEMGGAVTLPETNKPMTQQAPPIVARTAATHPPSALVPTLSLRKRSSAAETDAVRFSDDTSDADEDDTAKTRTVPPNPAAAVAAPATAAVAPIAASPVDPAPSSKQEDEDNECIHFDDPDTDAGEDEVAPLAGAAKVGVESTAPAATAASAAEQSASTKHVRDASLTATSTTLQTPTTVASQSQSSSVVAAAASSSLPRFSASSIPGFVYQHLSEVARKLPPDYPPVELHFGFDGFSPKWNEWVPIQSARIAPYGSGLTKTHGRGGATGVNLNAAYLTGPAPSGFGYNPQYAGSALSTIGGGSSYGYGYSSFGGGADVECGVIRVQILQRCAKPVPPVTVKATVLPVPLAAASVSSNTLAVPVAHNAASSSSPSSPQAPAPTATPVPDAVTGLTPSVAPVVPYDVQYFSVPLILWLDPRTTTTAQLYDQVWNKVRRYTSLPDVLTNPAETDHSRSASLDRAASAHVDALEQMAAARENGIVGTDTAVSSDQIHVDLSPVPVAVPSHEVAASALPAAAAATPAAAAIPGEPTVTASSCATLPPYFFANSTSPFTLRYSNGSGTQCSRCQTYGKTCIGCPIHLTVPNEEHERAEAIAAAAVIVDGDMQPVAPKPLVRDTLLISPGDRAAHVRSWHNDCTLLLDWNTDYMDAGLVDVNEQARLEIDPSVTLFRALAAREDHASKVDLNVCMSLFTQTEKLSGDAAVYCSACKTHEEATKTLELYSTPPLLVLHLKRLLPDTKLFTDVRFPLKGFDPKPFLASSHPTPAPVPSAKKAEAVVEEAEEKQSEEQKATAATETPAVTHTDPVVILTESKPVEAAAEVITVRTPEKSDESILADVHALVKAVNSKEPVVSAEPTQPASTEATVAAVSGEPAFRVEVTQAAGTAAATPPETVGAAEVAAAATAVPAASEIDPAAAAAPAVVVTDQPTADSGAVAPAAVSPPLSTPSSSPPAAAAASSATPSPAPVSPPVFTPVAGGFDASVAGGAPSAHGKSKSSAPDLYDLYAVVHHFGAVGGGHYIAYALDRDRGLWFRFDDAKLTQIAEDKVVSNSAYMLFYERRGLSQNAGVDAVPPAIRNKALDAKGRRLLKESNGNVANCQACTVQ